LYSELGLETVQIRRKLLAEKYVIGLGHKPCNAAYGSVYYLFHSNSKWKKRSQPSLNPFLVDLRERGFNLFTDFAESAKRLRRFRPPPPWSASPFDSKFFKMSKSSAKSNQKTA